jgi:adenine deaminase
LQDAANGRIRLVTYPQSARSPRLVAKLVANRIAVETSIVESTVDDRVAYALASGASVADAIDIACVHPYQILGLSAPSIEVGVPVNFLLFDVVEQQIQLRSVLTT